MTISYYENGAGSGTLSHRLIALMIGNAAVSALSLSAWTLVSLFFAEPISWATWVPINRGDSADDIFKYPFVLLWLIPLAGCAAAWAAAKLKRQGLAYLSVLLPLTILGMIFGWYYLAPEPWH